jgi:hypothetical protein
MYTITITNTTRGRVVDTGTDFIDIQKDGETVAERKLGFSLDATAKQIRAELQAVLAAYVRDQEIAAETQRSEEQNAHAHEVQADLEGMTIEHESVQ